MYTTVHPKITPPACLASIKLKKYQDTFIISSFKIAVLGGFSPAGLHKPKNYSITMESTEGGGRLLIIIPHVSNLPVDQIKDLLVEVF